MAGVRGQREGCEEFRRTLRLDRRAFVQAGVLGTMGPTLADVLRSEARADTARRTTSVIILWMRGGPSHIDMWDPKPDAPAEYRGEFGVTATRVPGIQISDMLPRCAQIMDQWSIVRSLHHTDAGHSTGDQFCFTGYPPGREPDVNAHPSCGSIVAKQLGRLNPALPAYVMIPRMVPGTGPAYLGVGYRPFETQADPADDGPFEVPNLTRLDGLSGTSLVDRRRLLGEFDRLQDRIDSSGQMSAADRFEQQAMGILTSRAARDAFDLEREPRAVRERYGFMPRFDPGAADRCGAPAWSQRILLARRLVEAGVRLVTVDLRWWDTHVLGFDSLRRGFLPRYDLAYSALIEDLDQRGLLDSTLVVSWGEFGRTPKVNDKAGRDHYPFVFSAALAGGPVEGGRVLGASDAKGAFPARDPRSPLDVLATIYAHLGVDSKVHYENEAGRPIAVLPGGRPLRELS